MSPTRLICIVLLALVGAVSARAESGFQTSAPSALLMDHATGTILFEKDADKPLAPASLAKVMTAAVVFGELKAGKITLDTPFMVSVNAWRRGGGPSGKAAMFAEVNKPVRVGDLLSGALVVSGNDAAIALAEGVAGTEGEFALRMNETAKKIGMTGSVFRDATGYFDPDQVSTARDLAVLARYVIATYPEYYPIFSQPSIEWSKIKQRNRNVLLDAGVGADGLQTGWLKEVGYNLLGSAVQNHQRLIVVVLGAKTDKERLSEARRLLDWGFLSFKQRQLFAEGAPVGRAQVFGGTERSVPLVAKGPVMLLAARSGGEKISARVAYPGPLLAPVAKGAPVGHLEVMRAGVKVLDVALYADRDVPVGTLWQRAVDGGLTLMGDSVRDLAKKAFAALKK